MDKMNYPRGLVRYSTEHAMKEGETRVLRPRVLVYAVLLLVLVGGLVTSMVTRTPIILDVIRDRNFLYRELPSGEIENIYTLKVINQRNDSRSFRLTVEGVPGIELDGVSEIIAVDGGGVLSLPVRVRAPAGNAYGIMDISFGVTAVDDPSAMMTEDSRFLGPTP
jgi:polyferredoxin